MYHMMKIRIGTPSRISVGIVGYVCHRMLPISTEVPSAISARTPAERAPVRLASTQAANAASRKDTLENAFSGSANTPIPTRSQYASIVSERITRTAYSCGCLAVSRRDGFLRTPYTRSSEKGPSTHSDEQGQCPRSFGSVPCVLETYSAFGKLQDLQQPD
jgi:hypothetical protein